MFVYQRVSTVCTNTIATRIVLLLLQVFLLVITSVILIILTFLFIQNAYGNWAGRASYWKSEPMVIMMFLPLVMLASEAVRTDSGGVCVFCMFSAWICD